MIRLIDRLRVCRRLWLIAGALLGLSGIPVNSAADQQTPVRVSLNLNNSSLPEALGLLFKSAGVSYSIAQGVPKVLVTVQLNEVPLKQALETVLQAASTPTTTLFYTMENGIYRIGIREGSAAPATDEPEHRVYKIILNYLRAADLAQALTGRATGSLLPVQGGFGAPGSGRGAAFVAKGTHVGPAAGLLPLDIDDIYPGPDNSLLVKATPDAVRSLRDVINLLDVPVAMMIFKAGVSGPGLDGRPFHIQSSVRGMIGAPLRIDEEAGPPGHTSRLHVSLSTIPLSDGSILVDSDWEVSVPVYGGKRGPVRIVKKLATTARILPGASILVADVDLSTWGGNGALRLWLRADSVPRNGNSDQVNPGASTSKDKRAGSSP